MFSGFAGGTGDWFNSLPHMVGFAAAAVPDDLPQTGPVGLLDAQGDAAAGGDLPQGGHHRQGQLVPQGPFRCHGVVGAGDGEGIVPVYHSGPAPARTRPLYRGRGGTLKMIERMEVDG